MSTYREIQDRIQELNIGLLWQGQRKRQGESYRCCFGVFYVLLRSASELQTFT